MNDAEGLLLLTGGLIAVFFFRNLAKPSNAPINPTPTVVYESCHYERYTLYNGSHPGQALSQCLPVAHNAAPQIAARAEKKSLWGSPSAKQEVLPSLPQVTHRIEPVQPPSLWGNPTPRMEERSPQPAPLPKPKPMKGKVVIAAEPPKPSFWGSKGEALPPVSPSPKMEAAKPKKQIPQWTLGTNLGTGPRDNHISEPKRIKNSPANTNAMTTQPGKRMDEAERATLLKKYHPDTAKPGEADVNKFQAVLQGYRPV